jgi:hypothetical protein
MLGIPPFYNQTIRRVMVAFGTMFKDTVVIKYDANTRAELGRSTVPIEYAGKETYIQRLDGDPTLQKGVQIVLPRMSFELLGMKRDENRQTSSYNKLTLCQTAGSNAISSFSPGMPYDLNIQLNLYVRNQEDGLQVIEQILPFFTPDYTLNLKYLSCDGGCTVSEDLPFVLENINYSNNYEGPGGSVRYINWSLDFIAKTWFYGPLSSGSVIKTVDVNINDIDSGNTQATIIITPNPPTANATDDYGFTTIIKEFA